MASSQSPLHAHTRRHTDASVPNRSWGKSCPSYIPDYSIILVSYRDTVTMWPSLWLPLKITPANALPAFPKIHLFIPWNVIIPISLKNQFYLPQARPVTDTHACGWVSSSMLWLSNPRTEVWKWTSFIQESQQW